MSIHPFRFRVLSVFAALFLGALLLSSCDSGADFSSLDDLSSDSAPVAKVRAWYDGQMQDVEFLTFASKSGDGDSLAFAALVEKFPPDWSKAVMLSREDGGKAMAATLGQYTDEKYDTTYYHVRTILFDLDSSGDVESSSIVVFSSRDELSKDGFDTYAGQYIKKDFGDVEMIVSRYTTRFEAVDAFMYRSGQIPLELSISLTKEEISSSGKLGKLGANASIMGPDTICFEMCYLAFGRQCNYLASDPTDRICTVVSEVVCVDVCYEPVGGGGDGSGGGSGGGGGDGTEGEGEGEDEDECSCSDETKCTMEEEYNDSSMYTRSWVPSCDDIQSFSSGHKISSHFTWSEFNDNWSGGGSRHSPYGIVDPWITGVLEDLRSAMGGTSMNLEGGYRCPHGNQSAGGRKDSYHMIGKAADIDTPNEVYWDRLYDVVRARNNIDFPGRSQGRDAAYNYYGGGLFHVEPL